MAAPHLFSHLFSHLSPRLFAITLFAALSTLLGSTTWAQANAGSAYAGGGVGQGRYKWTNNPAGGSDFCVDASAVATVSCKDKPIGYKAFVGYNINAYLGVEGTYYRAGTGDLTYTDSTPSTIKQRVILNGFGLSAVGTLPLGPAFVSGRVGVAAATVTRQDDQDGARFYEADRTKAAPIFGASVGSTIWRSVAVRLDWDRVRGKTAFDEKFEADLFTFNLMYRFE